MRIDRPIFFIGMPRSGTTILFEVFAVHEDLGWISNYSSRFPVLPSLNLVVRLADNKIWSYRGEKEQITKQSPFMKLLPKPQEGYPFWNRYCGDDFLWKFRLEQEKNNQKIKSLRRVIDKTLMYQCKTRFATKLTGSPRINYIRSIFPDAVFVHVIRDGRAVVNSLLNVGFWKKKGGLEKAFWNGILSDKDKTVLAGYDNSPVALAAIEWKNVIMATREEAAVLSNNEYFEIRYEDFVSYPSAKTNDLYKKLGLSISGRVDRYLKEHTKPVDMNEKYKQMDVKDIQMMEEIMGGELHKYRYLG